ncbi:MAG: hypothetical protein K2N18_04410 [Clostridia bacterium]|nr:hypothetical protein [Clostridia bacterium]
METVILVLLLLLSDKKNDFKQSLNRFLCFYKENRELIRMLANVFSSPASTEPSATEEHECGHEESRPREEVGNASILEEVLRRVNA